MFLVEDQTVVIKQKEDKVHPLRGGVRTRQSTPTPTQPPVFLQGHPIWSPLSPPLRIGQAGYSAQRRLAYFIDYITRGVDR